MSLTFKLLKINKMKKITLLLLLISTTTFSQTYGDTSQWQYDKMVELIKQSKNEESKIIADELLSGKYGKLDAFTEFFTLYAVANYYYKVEDYQKAHDFYQQFLDFDKDKKTKNIEKTISYLQYAKAKLEELNLKLSLISSNTINSSSIISDSIVVPTKSSDTLVSENISNDLTIKESALDPVKSSNSINSNVQIENNDSSSDKTIKLTVSGTGKTLEDAKTNALRSAIEQAFGAFISSKTEILNDNLVKDEIVSISNGNIQKYDLVSQVEVPGLGYSITLNATVSISKLTSFAQSKGVSVEVKGGLFAANIIQKELNEKAELISLQNILNTSNELLRKSFDYSIDINGSPKLTENKKYRIPLKVKILINNNYTEFEKYIIKSLCGLSMSNSDVINYKEINKPFFLIALRNPYELKNNTNYSGIYLRNRESIDLLNKFLTEFRNKIFEFEISCNINKINGADFINGSLKSFAFSNFIIDFNKTFNKTFQTIIEGSDFGTLCNGINGELIQVLKFNKSDFKRIASQGVKRLPNSYENKYKQQLVADIDYLLYPYNKYKFLNEKLFNNFFPKIEEVLDYEFGAENMILNFSKFEEGFLLTDETYVSNSIKENNEKKLIVLLFFEDTKSLEEIKELSEYKITAK
jgi:hypothetical protein